MSKIKLFSLTALLLAGSAHAHTRWILPTHFNVSAEEGKKNVWIMADVTASNETFHVDKPMGSDNLTILQPNGKSSRADSSFRGHRKSVVDINLTENGTYKMFIAGDTRYVTSYKMPGSDKAKRMRDVNKANRDQRLPKGATDVKTMAASSQVMTFITLNQPTDNFGIKKQGLELMPITHPSDIAQNEETTLQFLFDGKPQANVSIEIIKDGSRYRNDAGVQTFKTDKSGNVTFTLAEAGRYILVAKHRAKAKNNPLAEMVSGQIFLTFEAVLN
jgi:uncharacterized GH25 family protein